MHRSRCERAMALPVEEQCLIDSLNTTPYTYEQCALKLRVYNQVIRQESSL